MNDGDFGKSVKQCGNKQILIAYMLWHFWFGCPLFKWLKAQKWGALFSVRADKISLLNQIRKSQSLFCSLKRK